MTRTVFLCEHSAVIAENNALRKANEKLRAENARLAAAASLAEASGRTAHAMATHHDLKRRAAEQRLAKQETTHDGT